uniref:Uncharacterized protein n=1 Tax=Oryza sativa subsp. japonica TaxID=39947 RepID=Q53M72_ORYSJ|nr:hypothetical protein LOC_Os11g20330 [Oryza sativa Japonica Group]
MLHDVEETTYNARLQAMLHDVEETTYNARYHEFTRLIRRRKKIEADLVWNLVEFGVGLRIGWIPYQLEIKCELIKVDGADGRYSRYGMTWARMGLYWDNRHCQLEIELRIKSVGTPLIHLRLALDLHWS